MAPPSPGRRNQDGRGDLRVQTGVQQVAVGARQGTVTARCAIENSGGDRRQARPFILRPHAGIRAVEDCAEHMDAQQFGADRRTGRAVEPREPVGVQQIGEEAELFTNGPAHQRHPVVGILTDHVRRAPGVVCGGLRGHEPGHHRDVPAHGPALDEPCTAAVEHRAVHQAERRRSIGETVAHEICGTVVEDAHGGSGNPVGGRAEREARQYHVGARASVHREPRGDGTRHQHVVRPHDRHEGRRAAVDPGVERSRCGAVNISMLDETDPIPMVWGDRARDVFDGRVVAHHGDVGQVAIARQHGRHRPTDRPIRRMTGNDHIHWPHDGLPVCA